MRAIIPILSALLLTLSGCEAMEPPSVSGTISVPADKQASIKSGDTLFIVARPAGEAEGPPLAIKRIVGATFPLTYSFDPRDVVVPTSSFEGQVEIGATIRKTGFAQMKAPGDLEGSYPEPVAVGTKGVNFTLDRSAE